MAIILIAILFFSCNQRPANSVSLLGSAPVDESQGVLHNMATSVYVLNDSLAGIKTSPLQYFIFNYNTGKVFTPVTLDTSKFPSLIRLASTIDKKNYEIVSYENLNRIGLTPFEILNVYKNDSAAYVFYYLVYLLRDSISYKGEKVMAENYKKGLFINKLSPDFKKTIGTSYTDLTDYDPIPNDGVEEQNNSFVLRNYSSITTQYMMVHLSKRNDSVYSAGNGFIGLDSLSKQMFSERRWQKTSTCKFDGHLYVCNGHTVYDSNDRVIYKFNNSESEEIVCFSIDKNKIKFYTSVNTEKNYNKIYSYYIQTGVLNVLKTFDDFGIAGFYKNRIIRLSKKEDKYYFSNYEIL